MTNENILMLILGIIGGMAALAFVCYAVRWIVTKIDEYINEKVKTATAEQREEVTKRLISLDELIDDWRLHSAHARTVYNDSLERAKANEHRTDENNLAKNIILPQNNSQSGSESIEPPFLKNSKKLTEARRRLENGDMSGYQDYPELQDLAPLDAFRLIDEAEVALADTDPDAP